MSSTAFIKLIPAFKFQYDNTLSKIAMMKKIKTSSFKFQYDNTLSIQMPTVYHFLVDLNSNMIIL